MKRDDIFYAAMRARDHRFDGKFFVGVKTTGIYCRPICPAQPKRENVEFFLNTIDAERSGYRPCLRCRPESAPQSPAWIGKSAIVRRAIKILNHQETIEFREEKFAQQFGVSARHLRRVFVEEVGKTPKQLSFENRLNLSRKLIVETRLPITEIAFASGFRSIRRFNEAFKNRFDRNPSEIRRSPTSALAPLRISLSYRPPFDFDGLLHFYRVHQVGELERFEDQRMIRIISWKGKVGEIAVSNDPEHSRLWVEIDFDDITVIPSLIAKVRALFDLDSDPVIIANAIETDPDLKRVLKNHPGIRIPSGWDPFEIAVSTILGQFVSIEFGRTLVGDLIQLFGDSAEWKGRQLKLFPQPERIAFSDLSGLRTTTSRKRTLIEFAKRVASGELSLELTQDMEEFHRKLLAIPGIGPWTASYVTLKVLRHTDAFPDTDLILARALKFHPKQIIDQTSPWRGYVAALLWREYSETLKKTKRRKK